MKWWRRLEVAVALFLTACASPQAVPLSPSPSTSPVGAVCHLPPA